MCEASQADRSSMPRGSWFLQNAIAPPNIRAVTPAARKWGGHGQTVWPGADDRYGASRHSYAGLPSPVVIGSSMHGWGTTRLRSASGDCLQSHGRLKSARVVSRLEAVRQHVVPVVRRWLWLIVLVGVIPPLVLGVRLKPTY